MNTNSENNLVKQNRMQMIEIEYDKLVFDTIPSDIWIIIICYLDWYSFFKCRNSCQFFYKLSTTKIILDWLKRKYTVDNCSDDIESIFTCCMAKEKMNSLVSPSIKTHKNPFAVCDIQCHDKHYGVLYLKFIFFNTEQENLNSNIKTNTNNNTNSRSKLKDSSNDSGNGIDDYYSNDGDDGKLVTSYIYYNTKENEWKEFDLLENIEPSFACHENGFFAVDESIHFCDMVNIRFLSTNKRLYKNYIPEFKLCFLIPCQKKWTIFKVSCQLNVIAIVYYDSQNISISFIYIKWNKENLPEFLFQKNIEWIGFHKEYFFEFVHSEFFVAKSKRNTFIIPLVKNNEKKSIESDSNRNDRNNGNTSQDMISFQKVIQLKHKNATFLNVFVFENNLFCFIGNGSNYKLRNLHSLELDAKKQNSNLDLNTNLNLDDISAREFNLEERIYCMFIDEEKKSMYLQGSTFIYEISLLSTIEHYNKEEKLRKIDIVSKDELSPCTRLYEQPFGLFLFNSIPSNKDSRTRDFFWSVKNSDFSKLGNFTVEGNPNCKSFEIFYTHPGWCAIVEDGFHFYHFYSPFPLKTILE